MSPLPYHRPPSSSNQSIISSLSVDVTLSPPNSQKQSQYPANYNLVSRLPPGPQLNDADVEEARARNNTKIKSTTTNIEEDEQEEAKVLLKEN